MKVVIAPQGFKGSLEAPKVAQAIEKGVRRALPDVVTVLKPMADGGEGTVQALMSASGGKIVTTQVAGPLGNKVAAKWGIFPDGASAVIEMAAASGITLVPSDKLNPLVTTTYGTGELILAALERGCRKIIVGLGGSATNDGGAGMAQAIGVRLLDEKGDDLAPGGAALAGLHHIEISGRDCRLAAAEILAATDVTNPLCGEEGCAAIYGPQKGATPEMVRQLDAALEHYTKVIRRDLGIDVRDVPGSGAAGGLGAGLLAFAGAKIVSGIEMVIEASGLAEELADADLVFTGEGRLDGQSAYGKVPAGVARQAKKFGLPVVALAGSLGKGYESIYEAGVDAVTVIAPGPISLEEAMADASSLITDAAERAMRLFMAGRKLV
ncbi:MAG: glycerate kinase [Chloroflexi bacterium]|nr:glycerate kinase [Chloroflexota bacterium]